MLKFYRNQYFRTIFLAVVATATFVGSAIFVFDVESKNMLEFFIASVIGVLGIIVLAVIASVFIIFLKKIFNRD